MHTATLKVDIINKITQLKKVSAINELKRVLDFELNEGVYKFNANQKKRIALAKVEIKQKKIISEVTANKKISEWLGK